MFWHPPGFLVVFVLIISLVVCVNAAPLLASPSRHHRFSRSHKPQEPVDGALGWEELGSSDFRQRLVTGDVSYLRAMLGGQGTRNLMRTSDSITEDISRIRDDLAAIVTRDLIAGKVTSPRDAPRIVHIGRAIANLGKVYSRVLDLEDVVEDLAAERTEEYADARAEDGPQTVEELWEGLARIERVREAAEERARQAEEIVATLADANPVVRDMGYHCVLCREESAEWADLSLSEHDLDCPWHRAVEWLDDAADSAVADASEVDIPQYAYRVQWSSEDGEYVATVAEFPSLSRLDLDPVKALQGLIDVVAEVVSDLGAAGEPIPEPENLGSKRGIPDEELVGEEE